MCIVRVSLQDWDMIPEEAVTLYLEWGNSWTHGRSLIKSKDEVSHYFAVNIWEDLQRFFSSGETQKRRLSWP